MFAGAREGLSYVWNTRPVLVLTLMAVVVMSFAFNVNVLLPVLSKQTLGAGPLTFGIVTACFGAGALVGSLIAAGIGHARWRMILGSVTVFGIAELLIAPLQNVVLVSALLFVCGICFTTYTAASNSVVQLGTPDHIRGRVLGVYFYAWTAPLPLASPLIGWLCTVGGTELAFVFGGLCALTAARARHAGRPALAARHAACGRPSRPPRDLDEDLPARAAGGLLRPGLGDVVQAEDLGLEADRAVARVLAELAVARAGDVGRDVEERVAEDLCRPCRAPSRIAAWPPGPRTGRDGRSGRPPAPRRARARAARPRGRRRSASPAASAPSLPRSNTSSAAAGTRSGSPRRADHVLRAEELRRLDGDRAERPARAEHEHGVVGPHGSAPRDGEPGGQPRDAAAERGRVADTVRDLEHPVRPRRA